MKLATAHDAFWFLTEHPKFKYRVARLVSDIEAETITLGKGDRIRVVKDQMPWRKGETYRLYEFAHTMESFPQNLDIFYTKVDNKGRVNDDRTKNMNVECWLEFGAIRNEVHDGVLHATNYHDIKLDCGAPTFDEALVKLARLVRRHYGDIKTTRWIQKAAFVPVKR